MEIIIREVIHKRIMVDDQAAFNYARRYNTSSGRAATNIAIAALNGKPGVPINVVTVMDNTVISRSRLRMKADT